VLTLSFTPGFSPVILRPKGQGTVFNGFSFRGVMGLTDQPLIGLEKWKPLKTVPRISSCRGSPG
jgi:hypothetical protein